MNASELRIGNVVGTFDSGGYGKLTPMVINGGNIIDRAKEWYELPLTEEWLVRFGFKEDGNGFHLEDRYSLSFSITKEREFLPCFNDRVLHSELKVKHVHQLQNLYFALTGKELECKP